MCYEQVIAHDVIYKTWRNLGSQNLGEYIFLCILVHQHQAVDNNLVTAAGFEFPQK